LFHIERDAETGGGVLAAAVGFRAFLFMVPYGFVVVMGLGFADDAITGSPGKLARQAGIGGLLVHAVNGGAHLTTGHRLVALVGGVFALFLAARTLVKVLRIASALAWKVPIPRTQSSNLPALVLTGVITLGLCLVVLVAKARSQGLVAGLAALLLFVTIPTAGWLFASEHLPHADVPRWSLLPGALLVGAGVLVLHAVSVYYLPLEISHKSATYGSIATALALLGWAYLAGRLLTSAAVLNAALWHRRQLREQSPRPPAG
jgi:membrane protein